MELVAKQQHHAGQQVALDYGRYPLQHMAYQYGFVPGHGTEGAMHEVFEDFGSIWEVLIVQASPRSAYLIVLPQLYMHFQALLRLMHDVQSCIHSQSVLCLCKCTLLVLAMSASRGVITHSEV